MRLDTFVKFFNLQQNLLLMVFHKYPSIITVEVVCLIIDRLHFFSIRQKKTSILASRSPPPRPPLPSNEELFASAPPPRPPTPELEPTEEETYDQDLPFPQSNQPILVRRQSRILTNIEFCFSSDGCT